MKKNNTTLTFQIPSDLFENLKVLARREKRSLSAQLVVMMSEVLENKSCPSGGDTRPAKPKNSKH